MPWVFTASEAAEMLGVHVQTVYDWLHSGEIPGKKVRGKWLIPKTALMNFLAHRPKPRPASELPDGGD
jgi:excisionase family DNA binding protein